MSGRSWRIEMKYLPLLFDEALLVDKRIGRVNFRGQNGVSEHSSAQTEIDEGAEHYQRHRVVVQ